MDNLIINRFRYKILNDLVTIRVSPTSNLLFEMAATYWLQRFSDSRFKETIDSFLSKLPANYEEGKHKISYDYSIIEEANYCSLTFNLSKIHQFNRSFLKSQLIDFFKSQSFLVEPFPTGVDIAVYQQTSSYTQQWGVYTRYDVVLFPREHEISISIGSTDTLICKDVQQINANAENVRAIDPIDGFIKRAKYIAEASQGRLVANALKRRELGVKNKIKKVFYQDHYRLINGLYDLLLSNSKGQLRFESGGFKTVHPADIGLVEFDKNLMLFGRDHTDVNAATGMRDGGAFEIPKERADRLKFLFIYQNSEQANSLYLSLKRGLKHFPGLLSYVGIPVNITNEQERLRYKSKETLLKEFEGFLSNDLKESNYPDYFAIVLVPSSKETATDEDSRNYFKIKEKLLQKGMPTQFIDSGKINSAFFHYYLPNISIAILAKIGGIPWKLKRKPYNELIIGFNEREYDGNVILGTAVYFDNSGKLQQVRSFKSTGRNELIVSLKNSINQFIEQNSNPPERLVIHYYKPPRREEVAEIHKLIKDEFRFNLPFAVVEINDTKQKTDLCFDVENTYGMPTSGTFVRLRRDEYLLFNNLRYWKNPIKPVNIDEYPVKIKLYNTESGGFSHRELLSQIYEFSRLYWKGLKQKSQPVTTQYAKMAAEFGAHFENGEIPENEISQRTAWFI
ncbi:MAG: Piwi domain-containing protein [Syntrophales bacterium]